jgi:orotate phosphoribosyltransferase
MAAENLDSLKKQLLDILKKDAFFRQKVVLSSGKESDFYIDARLVTLTSQGAFLTASIILELIKGQKIDAIGGPTLGADPIAGALAALSHLNQKPLNTFIVRKAPKPHGRMRHIEGPALKEGSRVILIDDVATTGKSLVEAIEKLKEDGVKVLQAIVLVDRQEGATESLAKVGCPLVAIFNSSDFLK